MTKETNRKVVKKSEVGKHAFARETVAFLKSKTNLKTGRMEPNAGEPCVVCGPCNICKTQA